MTSPTETGGIVERACLAFVGSITAYMKTRPDEWPTAKDGVADFYDERVDEAHREAFREAMKAALAEHSEQQAATIAELVEALKAANSLIEAMQHQARQYVEPSGYTSFDRKRIVPEGNREAKYCLFIDDIIYLLDGPEQREAQGKIAAALANEKGAKNDKAG